MVSPLVAFTFLVLALRPHPQNPHYFEFRGKPTVLITSGEHYGAVLNGAFDYKKYLDTLAADQLNLTRTFTGLYREVQGESFDIAANTLAPEEANFIQPFRRVGVARYDLSQWNEAYFQRWRDFVTYAGSKGIVVEVTLFTSYYNDGHWALSPLNANNNTQGVGKVKSDEVLALKEAALTEVQERFVRKLVTELKGFDNVYYEICNEPYFHGVTDAWQRRIAAVVAEADAGAGHMISRNIANGAAEIENPDPHVTLFNFHYARPPRAVAMNWKLNTPIGMNETGFDGALDAVYRIQAWDFLMAGGALYNNLDYSFTAAGHEDGTYVYPATQPGGGTVALRRHLRMLRQFFDTIPFVTMRPDGTVGTSRADLVSVRALSDGKATWAAYMHTGKVFGGYKPGYGVWSKKLTSDVLLDLPAGIYQVVWVLPSESSPRPTVQINHRGGRATLTSPEFSEDAAVQIRKMK